MGEKKAKMFHWCKVCGKGCGHKQGSCGTAVLCLTFSVHFFVSVAKIIDSKLVALYCPLFLQALGEGRCRVNTI